MAPTFAQLGVPETICRALSRRGINQPFEIQAATIADAIAGRDICGQAPTGSGKTLAFGIPIVAGIDQARAQRPKGLILAPTRELAHQITTELTSFADNVRVGVVYGGVGYGRQLEQLRRGVEILVACPGRLEDLIDRGALCLSEVDRVVIDEADRMADMGFLPAVRRILDQTAQPRQTVLFSATLDGEVARLTRHYQTDPVTHRVGDLTPDVTAAEHRFLSVERGDRVDTSARVIRETGQAIVFCRTRHVSDRVARQLTKRGVSAVAIHGGHGQNRRTRALARFSNGDVQALVATDVAARGLHVEDVALVVHYDLPAEHTTYVHRSGRTARAGRSGLVISLVQPDQVNDSEWIQHKLGLEQPPTNSDTKRPSTDPPSTDRPSTKGRQAKNRRRRRDRGRSAAPSRHRRSKNRRNRSSSAGRS